MATSPDAVPTANDLGTVPVSTASTASFAADGDLGAPGTTPDDHGLAGFGDADDAPDAPRAGNTLQQAADKAQELQQQWLDAYCEQVRQRPLAAIGLGVAAGMLLVRALF